MSKFINDVTTTPKNPPRFPSNQPPYDPATAAVQKEVHPDLAPLVLKQAKEKAFTLVETAAREMPGWVISEADAGQGRIVAVAVTKVLRFKDDVVVEVRPQGGASEVHVRSRSRLGRHDFGANYKRIMTYFGAIKSLQG